MKILKISLLVCILSCVVVYLYNIRPINLPQHEYKYSQQQIVYTMLSQELSTLEAPNKTKDEWKSLLEEKLNFGFYKYNEEDLPLFTNGLSNKFKRTITLDFELPSMSYVRTLTHEILHIKLFTSNETYVCYETFKFLYNDKDLRYAGIVYALGVFNGISSGEYDITNQITHYFLEGVY